jgi:hypothetical protein
MQNDGAPRRTSTAAPDKMRPVPPVIPGISEPLNIPPTGPDRSPPGVNEPAGIPDNTPQEVPATPTPSEAPAQPTTPQPRA